MTSSMQGKTVLITGANSGIGKETAVALARVGATVVFTARDPEKGEQAAADIRRRSGADVTLMPLDLASFPSIRHLADGFLQRYDERHVLTNNAGVLRPTPVFDIEEEEWDMVVNGNLKSTYLCSRAVLPAMRDQGWGRIVNFSSREPVPAGTLVDVDIHGATPHSLLGEVPVKRTNLELPCI